MSFCAICGGHHDPDVPCYNLTEQVLKDAGLRGKRRTSPRQFKRIVQKTNKSLIGVLLIFLAAILIAILVGEIISRMEHFMH